MKWNGRPKAHMKWNGRPISHLSSRHFRLLASSPRDCEPALVEERGERGERGEKRTRSENN
jgi:hypothetical protein